MYSIFRRAVIALNLMLVVAKSSQHDLEADSSTSKLAQNLYQSYKNLDADKTFDHFKVDFSQEEQSALESLYINKTTSYENFDRLDVLQEELISFLIELGNSEPIAKKVARVLERIVKEILIGLTAESAWVAVRSFTPCSLYDVPRWHTDGYYYEPFQGNQYKVVISLKGAGTLFSSVAPSVRRAFNALQKLEDTEETRQQRARLLAPHSPSSPFVWGQGSIFIVGSPTNAAIHSEPPIKEERLFMSVLPGTKSQIGDLYKRWKQ